MTFAEYALAFFLTAALNGAVLAAAWLAARALFPSAERSERALAAGTIAAALVAYPLLALGAAGAIGLPSLGILAAAALAFALWLHRRARPARPSSAPAAADAPSFAVASLYACAATYALDRALTLPPVSWDSLYYHLPMVVEWVQSGSLDSLYHPTGAYQSYFPGTGELFSLWLLLPWRNDFLAGFVNLPFLALQGIAVYRIARELGSPPGAARLAPPLFLVTPCVFRYAATSYVDPVATALLLTAFAWLLAFRRTRAPRDLLLFSAALGLAIGVKYSALLMALPLAAMALWYLRAAPRRLLTFAVAMPLPLLGAYWYWRNLWLTGHPLYPSEIEILGWEIFEGAPKVVGDEVLPAGRSILGSLADLLDSGDLWRALLGSPSTFTPDMGVGPKLLPLLLLGGFAAVRWRREAALAGATALLWFLFFLALPYWQVWFLYLNVRFLAPALGLCAALATLPLARAPPGLAVLAVACCVLPDLLALPLTFSQPARAAIFLAAALAAAFGVLARDRVPRFAVAAAGILAAALALGGGYAAHAAREEARSTRYAHGWDVLLLKGWRYASGWEWLDRTLDDRPARIAFTGSDFVYPLYGPRWTRTVRYVDVNRRAGGAHHAYPPGRFREHPDRQAWIENLRRFAADYLVVTKFHTSKDWPIEDRWAQGTFPRRAEGPMIRIYEVPR
jgi:hypothetical protein